VSEVRRLVGFPFPRVHPFEIPAGYTRLLAERRIERVELPSGHLCHLLTTYADVRALLNSDDVTSDPSDPLFPGIFPVRQRRAEAHWEPARAYGSMDRSQHVAHMRRVGREFGSTHVEDWSAVTSAVVDSALDRLAGINDSFNLVTEYAQWVPGTVMCVLLGFPPQHAPALCALSRILLSGGAPAQVERASVTLSRYLDATIRRRVPTGDDVLSRMLKIYRDGEYNHLQMLQIAAALLTGGIETTAGMLSLGAAYCIEHPEHMIRCLEGSISPAALTGELLRLLSVADLAVARVTSRDIEFPGGTVPAETAVIASLAAANHDPQVFPNPAVFDETRAPRHLGYGHGLHHCLGRRISSVVLERALPALFRRFPALTLADPSWSAGPFAPRTFHGLDRLLVTT